MAFQTQMPHPSVSAEQLSRVTSAVKLAYMATEVTPELWVQACWTELAFWPNVLLSRRSLFTWNGLSFSINLLQGLKGDMWVRDSDLFQRLSGGNFFLFLKSHCGSAWLISLLEGWPGHTSTHPLFHWEIKFPAVFHFTQFIIVAACLRKHTGEICYRIMGLLRMKKNFRNWRRRFPLYPRTKTWKKNAVHFHKKNW